MAIEVVTGKPKTLLAAIKKAIDDQDIQTWEYDSDGDFTHTPEQWRHKAWLRPVVKEGQLAFRLLPQKDVALEDAVNVCITAASSKCL